jgi:Subtilase family/Secretion system C-terminal sorting domain
VQRKQNSICKYLTKGQEIGFLLKISLLTFFMSLPMIFVLAKPGPKPTLATWQRAILNRTQTERTQLLRLAKQRNWSIHKNHSNGRVYQLQAIDATGSPIYYTTHNAEAATGTRTTSLYAGATLGLSLDGSSAGLTGKLGLWDGGLVLATHQELAGKPIVQAANLTTPSDHATHLATTLIGRGINPQARGMAFGAGLTVWDFDNDIAEITTAASSLLLSNHAYGPVAGWVRNPDRPGTNPDLQWEWWGNTTISPTEDYQFGFYGQKASDLDRIAFGNPFYLMVRSADNKRADVGPPVGTPYFLRNSNITSTVTRNRNTSYDVIAAEANAKNLLTVGSAEITNPATTGPLAYSISGYSGWGPTDDGRIKPDLLGVGTVFSAISSGIAAYGTNTGTSMASANVTGTLLLLQELFARQNAGQFMRSATLRGLVLHTANRNPPTDDPTRANAPDYQRGWGLLDAEAAARLLLNETRGYLMFEQTLQQGNTFTKTITAQGNEPVILTLCWTDPEGAATTVSAANLNNRTPRLVNDLDLRAADGSSTFLPFVLDPARPNQPATKGDNIRDNIEQVVIQNPTPGQVITLTVKHKGQLRYSAQPFSIIASGLQRTACQLAVALDIDQDTTICAGATITLSKRGDIRTTKGQTAKITSYQWLLDGFPVTGQNTPTCPTSQPGKYALRVTDSDGCVGTSSAISVQVYIPSATLTPTADQWLCNAKTPVSLTLTTKAGSKISWLRDGKAIGNGVFSSAAVSSFSATLPGQYQAEITQQGCAMQTNSVSVKTSDVATVLILPNEAELVVPSGASVRLQGPINANYRYQWYRNSQAITNANTDRILVSQAGEYRLWVRFSNCENFSPVRVVRLSDGTHSPSALPDSLLTYDTGDSSLVAYPNPATTLLHIRYARAKANDVRVNVFDFQGVPRLADVPMQFVGTFFQTDLPVGDLPPGIYFYRVTDGLRVRSGRFLKR